MKKILFLFIAIAAGFLFQNCNSTNTPDKYRVTIGAIPNEGGTVSPKGGEYEAGTKVEISAMPSDGWRFERWDGDYQGNNSKSTITVEKDMDIKAKFVKREYPLTIEIEGEGTVEETVIKSKSTDYEHGTKVELMAVAANGWEFVRWEEDLTGGTNPETITVNDAKTVKAVFEVRLFSITTHVTGQGAVKLIPDKTEFEHGESVEIKAEASVGWYFSHWEGDISGDENPIMINNVDNDVSLKAVFKVTPNTIVVNLPVNGRLTLFQADNALSGVAFASTEEVSYGDGNNGIWRTEDYGQNWVKTADFNVNFIAIAQNEPDLVFAGHDEGYLISQDGGKTWENDSINDERFGNPLSLKAAAIVSSDAGIYVATSASLGRGLYKTTNLGQSWQYVLTPDNVSDSKDASLEHVAVSPEDENIVYTSTSFDFNILKSTNGGNSFSSIKNGITISPLIFSDGVLVNPNNSQELLINGHISNNGGLSWDRQEVSPIKNLWIDDILIKVENNTVYGSFDLGQSWTTVLDLAGDSLPNINNPDLFLSLDALYLKTDNEAFKVDLSKVKENL